MPPAGGGGPGSDAWGVGQHVVQPGSLVGR